MKNELRQKALEILCIQEPYLKRKLLIELSEAHREHQISIDAEMVLQYQSELIPGRPESPILVNPSELKKRSMNTLEGRAVLLHALAHIEFNAINLALDAVWRFPNMPIDYYEDWLSVAIEESYHFELLSKQLEEWGFSYGQFVAHNSLWEMVEKTKNDVIARMALVPRTMESRGLDALPEIRKRFVQIKEKKVVDILDVILDDEIGHVKIGNRWYNFLCHKNGFEPIQTYAKLTRLYKAPLLKGPFNISARIKAGFTERELIVLQSNITKL